MTSATKRAESAASSAEGNADAANRAASAATAAAKQANAAASATKPYYMQAAEPARDKRVDGMLWMQTNESTHKITSFKRWDAGLPGTALWPDSTTFPSDTTFPDEKALGHRSLSNERTTSWHSKNRIRNEDLEGQGLR